MIGCNVIDLNINGLGKSFDKLVDAISNSSATPPPVVVYNGYYTTDSGLYVTSDGSIYLLSDD